MASNLIFMALRLNGGFCLQCYRNRPKGVSETDLSLREKLSKFEKEMLENQELVEIRGKVSFILEKYVRYFFFQIQNVFIYFKPVSGYIKLFCSLPSRFAKNRGQVDGFFLSPRECCACVCMNVCVCVHF